jgi:elongation factor G
MARGSLAGYPVVDVKVRLHDGKYHSVDSSDAAFQVAGARAFRTAMSQAGPVILEPLVKLDITVPGDMMGDVIGDLNSRHGKVMGTNAVGEMSIITALVPLAATLDYEPKLTSMTSGRGTFTMTMDRYEVCSPQTQDKVIKESGFKVADDED